MSETLVLFWSRLIIITILPLPTHGFWIKILDTVNSQLPADNGVARQPRIIDSANNQQNRHKRKGTKTDISFNKPINCGE